MRYSEEHEWLALGEGGVARVGISDFAQKQLGDIVSVELPKVGSAFNKMQPMAIVDSVKASSDIYSPASGEIVEVNEELNQKPELINQSPYGSGWIAKIRLSNLQELERLMTEEKYDEFVGESNRGTKEDPVVGSDKERLDRQNGKI